MPRLGIPLSVLLRCPGWRQRGRNLSRRSRWHSRRGDLEQGADVRVRQGTRDEFYGKGINVALGPVAGPLGRIARGGRNWEGLSNDPYLAGVAMGGITRGMQDAGVIATPKHFVLNEQEFRRRASPMGEAVSSMLMTEPSMSSTYSRSWTLCARARVPSCSYHRVRTTRMAARTRSY